MNKTFSILLIWTLSIFNGWATGLTVASLNPFVTELAEAVGGERIQLLRLFPLGGNPHTFSPTPQTYKQIATADVILLAGKHLETYKQEIPVDDTQVLIEVGRTVPSLRIDAKSALFACCPNHAYGGIDPHWWQDPSNMKRAARDLARELSKYDPENRDYFYAQAKSYGKKMDRLSQKITLELKEIPREKRILATAHAAFNYFCKAYHFKSIPVRGLTAERNPTPSYLKEVITTIQENQIPAIFPEHNANPKLISALVKETGVALGEPLISDSFTQDINDYESMMLYNVKVLKKVLVQTTHENKGETL